MRPNPFQGRQKKATFSKPFALTGARFGINNKLVILEGKDCPAGGQYIEDIIWVENTLAYWCCPIGHFTKVDPTHLRTVMTNSKNYKDHPGA